MPQSATCMLCHQTIATDKPGVQQLAVFAKSGQPIPWVRVYQTPSFVNFSHKTHLDHNNACQECHGPVAEREQLAKETDISMAGCVNCHKAKNAAVGCDTCHTLQQSNLRELGPETIDDVNHPRWGKFARSSRGPIWDVLLLPDKTPLPLDSRQEIYAMSRLPTGKQALLLYQLFELHLVPGAP
jgi:hypothetical protein